MNLPTALAWGLPVFGLLGLVGAWCAARLFQTPLQRANRQMRRKA